MIAPQERETLRSQETYYACRCCLLIFELLGPWRRVMINTLTQSLVFLVSLIRSSGSGRFLWCSYAWCRRWTLGSLSVMVLQAIVLGQIFHFPHIPLIFGHEKLLCSSSNLQVSHTYWNEPNHDDFDDCCSPWIVLAGLDWLFYCNVAVQGDGTEVHDGCCGKEDIKEQPDRTQGSW